MVIITLDTSCVSAWANTSPSDDPNEVAAIRDLVDRFSRAAIGLQVTNAYDRDFERWQDDAGRSQRLEKLDEIPVFQRAPGAFRLGVSVLNGPDLLGGNADKELDTRLREILEPERRRSENIPSYEEAPGKAGQIMSDIDHLIAHRNSGASWFATTDKRILKKAEQLRELGIEVARPTTIVDWIDGGRVRHYSGHGN